MSNEEYDELAKVFEGYSLEIDDSAQHLLENKDYFYQLAKRVIKAGFHRSVPDDKVREKLALYLIDCWGKHQREIKSLSDLDDWHRTLWLKRADSLMEFLESLALLPSRPAPPEKVVEAIADKIVKEISDDIGGRGGICAEWEQIDTEVMDKEIVPAWKNIIAHSIASLLPPLTLISDEEIKDVLEENQPQGFSWGVIHNTEMIKFRIVAQAQLDHDKADREVRMDWRPEGWKNLYGKKAVSNPRNNQAKAFEAGADAMLEALRKRGDSLYLLGVKVPTDPPYIKVTLRNDKGYWVFIPDNNSQLSHDKGNGLCPRSGKCLKSPLFASKVNRMEVK